MLSAATLRSSPSFTQTRVGQDGDTFRFPKIRTLSKHAATSPDKHAIANISIPPECAFLRNSHLDELPQLWLFRSAD